MHLQEILKYLRVGPVNSPSLIAYHNLGCLQVRKAAQYFEEFIVVAVIAVEDVFDVPDAEAVPIFVEEGTHVHLHEA